MSDNFFAYIERLQLLAFFAGYPVIYALVIFIRNRLSKIPHFRFRDFAALLPLNYALIGTLYTGMIIRNIAPEYEFRNLFAGGQIFLTVWAMSATLFWIPLLRRKKYISLLHSLVFFALLIIDIFEYTGSANEILYNDMKLYSLSILLNAIAFLFIFLLSLLLNVVNKKYRPLF
jgi:hypothetical protein